MAALISGFGISDKASHFRRPISQVTAAQRPIGKGVHLSSEEDTRGKTSMERPQIEASSLSEVGIQYVTIQPCLDPWL